MIFCETGEEFVCGEMFKCHAEGCLLLAGPVVERRSGVVWRGGPCGSVWLCAAGMERRVRPGERQVECMLRPGEKNGNYDIWRSRRNRETELR